MMGYVPNEMCILEGYNKLPPAYALEFSTKTGYLKKWCYWDIPQLNPQSRVSLSENELLDELESLLENSVKLQLEADVPVGVLLSGGIDSSLVTAMAVRSSKSYDCKKDGHFQGKTFKKDKKIGNFFAADMCARNKKCCKLSNGKIKNDKI